MFEHVRKWFPWHERAKRKTEFIKKLQEAGHGQPKIRFKDASKIPVGAMIIIQDDRDGSLLTAVYIGTKWHMVGTNNKSTIISTVEFEDMLTEKRNLASKKDKCIIFDQNELLNIDYDAHSSLAGFSKVQWLKIGNDDDD